jgi:hypothetical protein
VSGRQPKGGRRPEPQPGLQLSGPWTVALRRELFEDPPSVARLGRNPMEPEAPPDPAALSSPAWHVERREVPGCWEDWGWSKRIEGPVWFQRELQWRGAGANADPHAVIRFGGVSYFCHVWLNARYLGSHRGIWDSFELDASGALVEGRNLLCVEVFKPWERFFPITSTLAGFIPYVTCSFGGIWKEVSIRSVPAVRITGVYVYGRPGQASLPVEVELHNLGGTPKELSLQLRLAGRRRRFAARAGPGGSLWRGEIAVPPLEPWAPPSPVLHELEVTLRWGQEVDTRKVSFGVRSLEARGRRLELNGSPVYLRGVLHWMSYTDRIAPTWREARHVREMQQVRELGFNLVKQCLVVPPEEYLELADRTGMLIWIELPMWMPRVTEELREQARREYAAIVKQLRTHPSIVLWTLGCELDAQADADFLTELFGMVKGLVPGSPLLRDNSGSAEAYGGVELEISDFYDYHFYAEANHFPSLVDHFLPGWRSEKPLLFGEYCDSDTLRSVSRMRKETGEELWWSLEDPDRNPQGVRWSTAYLQLARKSEALQLPYPWERCIALSRERSLEYRKLVLERTRLDPRVAGYVVTNILDTPISTAGVLDVSGEPKYEPADLAPLNAEIVLAAERERRRIWARGGDRRQFLDGYNLRQGQRARYRIVASCYAPESFDGELRLRLARGEGEALAESRTPFSVKPGRLAQAGELEFLVPEAEGPYALWLTAELAGPAGVAARNRWELWAFPEAPEWGELRFELRDLPGPLGEELQRELASAGGTDKAAAGARASAAGTGSARATLVADRLDEEVLERYRHGGRALVILGRHTPPLTLPLPFWREGVPLLLQRSVFSRLPRGGFAGCQFLGVTPELALDLTALRKLVGQEGESLIRRIDARTLEESSYWMEWRRGEGALIVTTLPLVGGAEGAPLGIRENVLGAYLLKTALQELQ